MCGQTGAYLSVAAAPPAITYLDSLAVHAICAWCVGYAVTVVGGALATAPILRGHAPARVR